MFSFLLVIAAEAYNQAMKRILSTLFLAASFVCSSVCADEFFTKVAILGSSDSDDENSQGIHKDVLTRLFLLIKEKKASAVFFMGDMTLGGVSAEKGEEIPDVIDTYGVNWAESGYVYDSKAYQQQLDAFMGIVKQTLGTEIPIYPVLGFHESLGRDSAALVKRQFNARNQTDPASSALAYSVGIGNSFFVVFSTSQYDPVRETVLQHDLNHSLLSWIDKTLKDNRNKYDYFFAISYEPAYSTTAAEGKFQGLDANPDSRDALWRIFTANGVMAYFSTSEHLYDRTNRGGTWQLISGGAGAPLHKRQFDKAFYHFILLSIPNKKGKLPRIKVYDAQGSLEDAFDLVPRQYPVYQLRIS